MNLRQYIGILLLVLCPHFVHGKCSVAFNWNIYHDGQPTNVPVQQGAPQPWEVQLHVGDSLRVMIGLGSCPGTISWFKDDSMLLSVIGDQSSLFMGVEGEYEVHISSVDIPGALYQWHITFLNDDDQDVSIGETLPTGSLTPAHSLLLHYDVASNSITGQLPSLPTGPVAYTIHGLDGRLQGNGLIHLDDDGSFRVQVGTRPGQIAVLQIRTGDTVYWCKIFIP